VKKSKRIVSLFMAVALIAAMMVLPANAYSDGDREVLYYSYSIGSGERVGTSSSSMKRLYNREWVVSVASRQNNSYAITYGILDGRAASWDNALISRTTAKSGTGNFGSSYYNSTVGFYCYLGALIHASDVNMGVKTSGQWSSDAAR